MIRYACKADVPRLVELARREHAVSPWKDIAFDEGEATKTAHLFLDEMGRTLLVSDAGYLAGMVQPLGFTTQKVALEWAMYAEDGQGMRLVERFERWAQNMGAVSVIVHDMVSEGRFSRALNRRRAYRVMGGALSKRLAA